MDGNYPCAYILDVPTDVWRWYGDMIMLEKLRHTCTMLWKIPPLEPESGNGYVLRGRYKITYSIHLDALWERDEMIAKCEQIRHSLPNAHDGCVVDTSDDTFWDVSIEQIIYARVCIYGRSIVEEQIRPLCTINVVGAPGTIYADDGSRCMRLPHKYYAQTLDDVIYTESAVPPEEWKNGRAWYMRPILPACLGDFCIRDLAAPTYMTSFISLLPAAVAALSACKTVTAKKAHPDVKVLSPFIVGGVSKMSKGGFDSLADALGRFTTESSHLDPEQSAVVAAPLEAAPRHVRVIAGAGSGKTTTIIARVRSLMAVTLPSAICILTFNVKSRDNLCERLAAAFGFPVKFPVFTIDKYARDHLPFGNDTSVKEFCAAAAELPQETLDNMSREYRYVFFDEFQDVNDDQFALVRNLARGASVCVVGDDCQNIYEFRGTNNYYIINFDKLVPRVDTFLITHNYRSRRRIVDAANRIIEHNSDRIHKTLKCARGEDTRGDGSDASYIDVEFTPNPTKFICDQICERINIGVPPDNIAVLARNKVPLVKIETEFTKRGIAVDARLDDGTRTGSTPDTVVGRIVLSTIHRAKGLEWDTVYVVGLADKYFPSHIDGGIKNIHEERRLFYVATTRAKNEILYVAGEEYKDGAPVAISRFLHEISPMLPGWSQVPPQFLLVDDKNVARSSYPVTKVIEALQGEHLQAMRSRGLLAQFSPVVAAFAPICGHTPEITSCGLEADYGTYCDAYITRRLQCGHLIDPAVEMLIGDDAAGMLTPDEHRTLPEWFKARLGKSYEKYSNGSVDPDHVYDISLCPRICDGRNRLVYRDVRGLFADQTAILRENYERFLETPLAAEESRHKMRLEYNTGKKIVGVLDFITDDAVVEIKCSSAALEIEWVIQLLIYRAMLDVGGLAKLNKLTVVNIMRGEITTMVIPEDYDSRGLLDFVTEVLAHSSARGGVPPRALIDLDYKNGGGGGSSDTNNTARMDTPVAAVWAKSPTAAGFAAIDVENNTTTGKISEIGIAWTGADQQILKKSWNISGAVMDWRGSGIVRTSGGAAVPFSDAVRGLLEILAGVNTIVGHCLHTDLPKLTNNILAHAPEYAAAWRECLCAVTTVDTHALAKSSLALPNYKLATVYAAIGGGEFRPHCASDDAAATAFVYQKIGK
jgi:hypothetical protein